MQRKPQRQRLRVKKGQIFDAFARPVGEHGPGVVYTASGEIHRPQIILPDERIMRQALEQYVEHMKVLRPLTPEERQNFRVLMGIGGRPLTDLYVELVEKTKNPDFEAFLDALKKEAPKLRKLAKKAEHRIVAP